MLNSQEDISRCQTIRKPSDVRMIYESLSPLVKMGKPHNSKSFAINKKAGMGTQKSSFMTASTAHSQRASFNHEIKNIRTLENLPKNRKKFTKLNFPKCEANKFINFESSDEENDVKDTMKSSIKLYSLKSPVKKEDSVNTTSIGKILKLNSKKQKEQRMLNISEQYISYLEHVKTQNQSPSQSKFYDL